MYIHIHRNWPAYDLCTLFMCRVTYHPGYGKGICICIHNIDIHVYINTMREGERTILYTTPTRAVMSSSWDMTLFFVLAKFSNWKILQKRRRDHRDPASHSLSGDRSRTLSPCIVSRQVLFRVPGTSAEALETSIPGERYRHWVWDTWPLTYIHVYMWYTQYIERTLVNTHTDEVKHLYRDIHSSK